MSILRNAFAGLAALAAALVACGGGNNNQMTGASSGSSTGGGGAGGGVTTSVTTSTTSGPFMTAQHPSAPRVISFGGPVLTAPKVQLIVYSSDTHTSDIEKFLQELASTSYWSATTSEYGVGPLTILPTITITDPPPKTMTDTDLTNNLAAQTSGASPAWGAADPSTIYLFILPKGTSIDAGGLSCQDYDGYHDEANAGAVKVPYALVASCPGIDGPGVNEIEQLTIAISHELVEASTDPIPNTNTAFGQTDEPDIIWTFITDGELADMCEFNADSFFIPQGSTYKIQRSWSNAAAKAGKNPCVPVATTDPYFNSVPVLPDMIKLTGVQGMTKGVSIPVGMSKTIDLDLFSEAPTSGPWTVHVYDYNEFLGSAPNLSFSLDKTSGSNGDVLHLTITVKSYDSSIGGAAFVVESKLNGQDNLWMGAVGK